MSILPLFMATRVTIRFTRARRSPMALCLAGACFALGCSHRASATDAHVGHETTSASSVGPARDIASIPASASTVAERLAKSPRHGEYVTVRTGPSDSVRAWVVYPERSSKAPVVVVVHEIFGLSAW